MWAQGVPETPSLGVWEVIWKNSKEKNFSQTQDCSNSEKVGENPGSLVGRLLPRAEPTNKRVCAGQDEYPSCISAVELSKCL